MNEVVPIHGRGNFPTLEVAIIIIIVIIIVIDVIIVIIIIIGGSIVIIVVMQVKLCDLVSLVKAKLEQDGVLVREIRLNGSGASSVTLLPPPINIEIIKSA